MSASQWASDDVMALILMAMRPANRLAIQISMATGLRISDVLSLKTATLQKSNRPYVCDSKTGKRHRIYIPSELHEEALRQAGSIWIFEGRLDKNKHRTRNAIYKDIVNASKIIKHGGFLDSNAHITPHTARKCAAVRIYHNKGFDAARALLQHDKEHPEITMLYALSDIAPCKSKRNSLHK